jgi:hypothetical protein
MGFIALEQLVFFSFENIYSKGSPYYCRYINKRKRKTFKMNCTSPGKSQQKANGGQDKAKKSYLYKTNWSN